MQRALWLVIVILAGCGGKGGAADAGPDGPPPPRIRCDFADCREDFARTCGDEPQTLDCSAFGAACGQFTDTVSGDEFHWCDCGTLQQAEGFCLGGRFGVSCFDGLGGLADCGLGFVCVDRPQGPFGIGCECNNLDDGICPGISCGSDPDCADCTPSCAGRSCGDNGCGGECGQCEFGEECNAAGACTTVCVPDCIGKQCGDDGCGGVCGQCDGTCSAEGQCQGTCLPSCAGKQCGSDGCTEGACGTCSDGLECTNANQCACPFFETVKYTFTLAPQATFPAGFSFVALNLDHIGIDNSLDKDGTALGFETGDKQTFTMTVSGCRPNIRIRRTYAISGITCTSDETITGRTSFTIPAPTVNSNSCVAPPL
jgi:hypothetical protein